MVQTSRLRVVAVRALLAKGEALTPHVGSWVLLGRPVEETGGGWSFRTASVESDLVQTASGVPLLIRDDDVILPVKKRVVGAAFSSTVLLGRSESNDVVVAHASVSKLHARLELSVAGELTLSDAESSNGTKVRDVPLAPNEKQVLRSGTQVAFGSCSFLLVSVDELERILSRSGRNHA